MLFGKTGYIEFGYDEQIAKWAECAKKKSSRILANPAHLQKWLQCEGTWFVGVDARRACPLAAANLDPRAACQQQQHI